MLTTLIAQWKHFSPVEDRFMGYSMPPIVNNFVNSRIGNWSARQKDTGLPAFIPVTFAAVPTMG
jgi:hypothetical protein